MRVCKYKRKIGLKNCDFSLDVGPCSSRQHSDFSSGVGNTEWKDKQNILNILFCVSTIILPLLAFFLAYKRSKFKTILDCTCTKPLMIAHDYYALSLMIGQTFFFVIMTYFGVVLDQRKDVNDQYPCTCFILSLYALSLVLKSIGTKKTWNVALEKKKNRLVIFMRRTGYNGGK